MEIVVGSKVRFVEDYTDTFTKGTEAIVRAIHEKSDRSDSKHDLIEVSKVDCGKFGTAFRCRMELIPKKITINDVYSLVSLDQDIGMIQAEIERSLEHVVSLKELVKDKQAEYNALADRLGIEG